MKTFNSSLAKKRKKELGYIQPSKNNTKRKCEDCIFFEAFGPYTFRCGLISYEFERWASINWKGVCKEHKKYNEPHEDKSIYFKKYPMVEDIKVFTFGKVD